MYSIIWLPDRQPIKVLKPLNDRRLEREPTQSKLSYVDEEAQSDPEVIHKSHV